MRELAARETPEQADRRRQRQREYAARRRADPETRERLLEANRRYLREVRSTKRGRELLNAGRRAYVERLRREDPESYERMQEAKRASHRRRMNDPNRRARKRESDRVGYVMRRERKGATRRKRPARPRRDTESHLPVGPLLALVQRRIVERAHEMNPLGMRSLSASTNAHESPRLAVCERLGISTRTLYAWEHGERSEVGLDAVDAVLTRDGACMFEIYPREDGLDEERAAEIIDETLASWRPNELGLLPWAWAGLSGEEWLERQACSRRLAA